MLLSRMIYEWGLVLEWRLGFGVGESQDPREGRVERGGWQSGGTVFSVIRGV